MTSRGLLTSLPSGLETTYCDPRGLSETDLFSCTHSFIGLPPSHQHPTPSQLWGMLGPLRDSVLALTSRSPQSGGHSQPDTSNPAVPLGHSEEEPGYTAVFVMGFEG